MLTTVIVGNSRVRRILAAAALAGVELDYDKSFSMRSEWKTPEFLEKFPMGFLPVLEDGDFRLTECGAVAEYGECFSMCVDSHGRKAKRCRAEKGRSVQGGSIQSVVLAQKTG